MASNSDDEKQDGAQDRGQGRDAERPGTATEDPLPNAHSMYASSSEADDVADESKPQEDTIARSQQELPDVEDLDPANDLGRHAAERLREFVDQRYPQGIEHSPLPEQMAGEELSTQLGRGEAGSSEMPETAGAESASQSGGADDGSAGDCSEAEVTKQSNAKRIQPKEED